MWTEDIRQDSFMYIDNSMYTDKFNKKIITDKVIQFIIFFQRDIRKVLRQQGYQTRRLIQTKQIPTRRFFYYVFVSKHEEIDRENIKKIRMNLIESLKPTLDALYSQRDSLALIKAI